MEIGDRGGTSLISLSLTRNAVQRSTDKRKNAGIKPDGVCQNKNGRAALELRGRHRNDSNQRLDVADRALDAVRNARRGAEDRKVQRGSLSVKLEAV